MFKGMVRSQVEDDYRGKKRLPDRLRQLYYTDVLSMLPCEHRFHRYPSILTLYLFCRHFGSVSRNKILHHKRAPFYSVR